MISVIIAMIILKNANTVLSDAGFRVTCLKSGRLLLDYVKKNEIDMLLLDIKMPELDGFETMSATTEKAIRTDYLARRFRKRPGS